LQFWRRAVGCFVVVMNVTKRAALAWAACGALALLATGCARGPHVVAPDKQATIDRSEVEYPAQLQLTIHAAGLTAPTAIAFETSHPAYVGSMLIAESGAGGNDPKLFGFRPDGSYFQLYPRGTNIPFLGNRFRIYAPIGGIAVGNGKVYVSHRDEDGWGVITAFDYEGNHTTIVGDLPARGDHSVTDLAIHPTNGRLYFGLGSATNSGVVGLDNWDVGWLDYYPGFSDQSLANLKLNGYRFTTKNPKGGLFGGDDIAVTAPYQAFGASRQLRIPASPTGKPTAAIYSVGIDGGDLRVEAHGIRLPRGLVFNEYGNLFVTNNGMELRGTRPVKDDPDSILRIILGGQIWFGWPDYSADLERIESQRFQPPPQMIVRTGYPELAALVDANDSGLLPPDRSALLRAVFPPLSGAAKMSFVHSDAEAFQPFRGSVIVALSGDRSPFATSGAKLTGPQGFSVVRVDLDAKDVRDFVFNTKRLPASQTRDLSSAMERPIDVKFGPDGALYILDFGQMEVDGGQEKVKSKTGRVYRLAPIAAPASPATPPTTPPATQPAE
jgi:glucose/arabinose dehydrogenase